MSFKKTKVVMLSTNEKAEIGFLTQKGKKRGHLVHFDRPMPIILDSENQHLYFLSDDEIKVGDWYVNFKVNEKNWDEIIPDRVCKADLNKTNEFKVHPYSKYCKKIIATTDKNLIWLDKSEKNPELARPNGLWKCLPQPSEGFIQKFVDAYNTSKPITEADVEYNEGQCHKTICDDNCSYPNCFEQGELKINPKDNTITIKKVKDSWNRDEVATLILQSNLDSHVAKEGEFDIMHWIEKNL